MVWSALVRCPRPLLQRSFASSSGASASQSRERTSSISVHKGLKVQAAVCVERPPLRFLEPDFKKRWRAFREAWELRTNNQLSVEDELVFMRFHFHFFQDRQATEQLAAGATAQTLGRGTGGRPTGGGRKSGGPMPAAISAVGNSASSEALMSAMRPKVMAKGGIDSLLTDEGLDMAFPELGQKVIQRRRVERKKVVEVDENDLHSLERKADSSLYLLVRYASGKRWTFPKGDRAHGQPMRETLLRLCARQLGHDFSPYIVGACPFTYRKRKSEVSAGIEGRKIFYYRARVIPGSLVVLPSDSNVADWAWCSREELPDRLEAGEWSTVRDSLPLDGLMLE